MDSIFVLDPETPVREAVDLAAPFTRSDNVGRSGKDAVSPPIKR